MKITKPKFQEEGLCPKCGKEELEYGNSEPEDNSLFYEFTCLNCGCVGREYYTLEYSETIIDGVIKK
jgi:hypothetical protein